MNTVLPHVIADLQGFYGEDGIQKPYQCEGVTKVGTVYLSTDVEKIGCGPQTSPGVEVPALYPNAVAADKVRIPGYDGFVYLVAGEYQSEMVEKCNPCCE